MDEPTITDARRVWQYLIEQSLEGLTTVIWYGQVCDLDLWSITDDGHLLFRLHPRRQAADCLRTQPVEPVEIEPQSSDGSPNDG